MSSISDIQQIKNENDKVKDSVAEQLREETSRLKSDTDKRFTDVEKLTRAILFVAIISLVGIVVSVGALIFDQVRFNFEHSIQQQEENSQVEVIRGDLDKLKGSIHNHPSK